MSRLRQLPGYVRDVGEVLLIRRFSGTEVERGDAQLAASVVRQTRFHARARIPHLELTEVVARLAPEPLTSVVVPGPRQLGGVGNATYHHALASLVAAVSPKSVLEFGTYYGVGTLTIALNAPPECRIVTLDLPESPEAGSLHDLNAADRILVALSRNRVGEAFLGTPFAERIHQIYVDSLTWDPGDTLEPMDLVFVDGGHSDAVVRADTRNGFRLLSPTGVVIWDDYFNLYPEVVAFLESLLDEGRRLYAVRGTNFVVYSPVFDQRPSPDG